MTLWSSLALIKHIGIKEQNSELSLNFKNHILNHIKTIHASTQFALAKTQSGLYLQSLFPEFVEKMYSSTLKRK